MYRKIKSNKTTSKAVMWMWRNDVVTYNVYMDLEILYILFLLYNFPLDSILGAYFFLQWSDSKHPERSDFHKVTTTRFKECFVSMSKATLLQRRHVNITRSWMIDICGLVQKANNFSSGKSAVINKFKEFSEMDDVPREEVGRTGIQIFIKRYTFLYTF